VTFPDTWRTGRVAVVMMSAVGDTVHALAVVTALKRHAPGGGIRRTPP
jgi:ADP-heptose:LPS heptosyltransferase